MKDYLNTIIAGVNRVFYLYNYSDIHKIFGINDKGYINDLAIIKTLQDKILFADTSNMSKDERNQIIGWKSILLNTYDRCENYLQDPSTPDIIQLYARNEMISISKDDVICYNYSYSERDKSIPFAFKPYDHVYSTHAWNYNRLAQRIEKLKEKLNQDIAGFSV